MFKNVVSKSKKLQEKYRCLKVLLKYSNEVKESIMFLLIFKLDYVLSF